MGCGSVLSKMKHSEGYKCLDEHLFDPADHLSLNNISVGIENEGLSVGSNRTPLNESGCESEGETSTTAVGSIPKIESWSVYESNESLLRMDEPQDYDNALVRQTESLISIPDNTTSQPATLLNRSSLQIARTMTNDKLNVARSVEEVRSIISLELIPQVLSSALQFLELESSSTSENATNTYSSTTDNATNMQNNVNNPNLHNVACC